MFANVGFYVSVVQKNDDRTTPEQADANAEQFTSTKNQNKSERPLHQNTGKSSTRDPFIHRGNH